MKLWQTIQEKQGCIFFPSIFPTQSDCIWSLRKHTAANIAGCQNSITVTHESCERFQKILDLLLYKLLEILYTTA